MTSSRPRFLLQEPEGAKNQMDFNFRNHTKSWNFQNSEFILIHEKTFLCHKGAFRNNEALTLAFSGPPIPGPPFRTPQFGTPKCIRKA